MLIQQHIQDFYIFGLYFDNEVILLYVTINKYVYAYQLEIVADKCIKPSILHIASSIAKIF